MKEELIIHALKKVICRYLITFLLLSLLQLPSYIHYETYHKWNNNRGSTHWIMDCLTKV